MWQCLPAEWLTLHGSKIHADHLLRKLSSRHTYCIFYTNPVHELLAMNFGYEPENIVSLPDAQSDLRAFWDEALAELAGVDPQYNMPVHE